MEFVTETQAEWLATTPVTAAQTHKTSNCKYDIGDVVDWLRTIAETSAPAVTRVATLLTIFVQTRTLSGRVSPRGGREHLDIESKKFTARLKSLETRGLISRSGSAYRLVRQSVEARARACGAGRRTGKLTAARVRSQGAPFTVLAARAAAAIPNRSRSLASWRFQWATTAIIESRGGRLEIRLILAVEAGTRVIDDAGNVGFVTRIADLAREFGTSVREVRKALASLEQKSWVVTTRYDRVGLTGTDAVTIVPIRPDRLAVLVEDPVTIEAATMLMDRIADRTNRAPRPVKPGTPYSIDLVIDSSSLRSEARKGALGRRIQDDPEKTNRSTHNPTAGWAARFAQRLEALGGSGKAVRQGGQSGARLSDLQVTAVTDLLGCCVAAVNSPIITVSDGTRRSICDAFQRHERHLASGRAATWRLRHPTKSIAQWIAQDVANDPAIAALLAEASGRGDHTAAELDAAISIAAPFVAREIIAQKVVAVLRHKERTVCNLPLDIDETVDWWCDRNKIVLPSADLLREVIKVAPGVILSRLLLKQRPELDLICRQLRARGLADDRAWLYCVTSAEELEQDQAMRDPARPRPRPSPRPVRPDSGWPRAGQRPGLSCPPAPSRPRRRRDRHRPRDCAPQGPIRRAA